MQADRIGGKMGTVNPKSIDSLKEALLRLKNGDQETKIHGVICERYGVNKWRIGDWRAKVTGVKKAAELLSVWIEYS
jgi:hypothetical protein